MKTAAIVEFDAEEKLVRFRFGEEEIELVNLPGLYENLHMLAEDLPRMTTEQIAQVESMWAVTQ